ncbi:uncharacterized protein N7498_001661 [Penicillium cinerascens]|uniref:Uncharacterized protein n=1 Tax=Penicillium cinerascens TaxID=70096 RepID=A0A9W9TAH4_9EURO|nr:uncharacterized protein N7498_001661 [Penicillium cinerascens]KAJ5215254.1 hypothetical protein N7498_001661 [Penicillium cinerascens]
MSNLVNIPTGWKKQSPNYDVSLKKRKKREKKRGEREKRQSGARETQNCECSRTHCFAFSIAATTLYLKRFELRPMRLSRPKATRLTLSTDSILNVLSLGLTSPDSKSKSGRNSTLDYVATNIQNKPIYSEASLRNFERDTVDNFVEMVIEKLRDDETLRHEFGI